MIRLLLLPFAIMAAFVAQAVGASGSCADGDTASWFGGAMTSLPFFTIILLFAALTLLLRRSLQPRLDILAYGIVAVVALVRLLLNLPLLKILLLEGAQLCDVDQGALRGQDYFIAFAYGALPLVTAALSLWAAYRLRIFTRVQR